MTPGADPAAELERSLAGGAALAARRRPARGGVHALPGRGGPGALHRRADRPVGDRLGGSRGHAARRLLRPLRRASAPRPRRSPGTSTCSAPCRATSFAGRSRARRARPGSGSRPASSTRCWPTSRASPALFRCSRTPSTSRGCAGTAACSRSRATVAAGGVRGAIAHTAEEVFVGCSPEEQVAHAADVPPAHRARRGDGGHTAAGSARGADRRRRDGCGLERLAGARLLVVGDDSAEIAHEALIREWPRLRGWLAEDREELRTLRQLTTAARSWDETDATRPTSIAAPRLAAAVELRGDERQLSGVERDFLGASQDAQDARADDRAAPRPSPPRPARRRRRGAGGGGDRRGASRSSSAAARGTRRRSPRRGASPPSRARSPRSTRTSGSSSRSRPAASTTRSTRAARCSGRSSTARGSARGCRTSTRPSTRPRSARAEGSWRPRPSMGRRSGTRRRWRPVGPPLRSSQGGWEGVDFSPDGRTLAIAGGEGRVELWDVATRKELRELTDPAAAASGEPALAAVRYSPDGSVIAAGAQETNHVTLWAAATGRVIGRPITTNPPGLGRAVDLVQPGLEADRRPGRPRDRGDLGGRHGRRVGKPLAIGSADVGDAIFAEGRPDADRERRRRRGVLGRHRDGTADPPAALGRRRIAGALDLSPDGRLLAVGDVRRVGLRLGREDRRAVRLPAHGRHEPGQRRRVQPGRPDAGERAPALGGRLEHGRRAGDRGATGRTDRPDHRHVVQPRRHAARRRAVRRRTRSLYDTATRRTTRSSDRRRLGRHGSCRSLPTGSSSPSGRSTARCGSSTRRAGRRSGSPARRAGAPPSGRSRSAPTASCSRWPWTRTAAGTGSTLQQRQGEVQLWDVDSRARVGRSDHAGRRIGDVAVAFSRDGTLLATGSRGRLDLWDVATQARTASR